MQFPWPIQLNDFPPYADKLSWKPGPRPTRFSVRDDEHVTLGDDEAGSICELFLHMASNETEDAEGDAELNDHFIILWPVLLPERKPGESHSYWKPETVLA